MTPLVRKLLTASGAAMLCIAFAACSGGSSGAGVTPPTSSAPPTNPAPPTDPGDDDSASSVQGVATPSSVSVVTATNAD